MRQFRRRDSDRYPADRRTFGRSSGATVGIAALLLLAFGVVWHAHQRARFHQLTAPVIPQTTSAPMPGGQEAILLSRVALVDDAEPEFVSATVLPGIGMQLLQAAVAVPDRPVQNLLASVSVSEAAQMPTESITSAPFHLRVGTHHLRERTAGDEDLIGLTPASDAKNQTLVDGGQASGTFKSSKSSNDISATVEVTLSGRQIDMVARATNHSEESWFVAFEWSPRFALPQDEANSWKLYVPTRGVSGKTGGAAPLGSVGAFSSDGGSTVGAVPFDVRFTLLGHDYLSDGTYVRLQDGDKFYLRVLGLGDTLRSVRAVNEPANHTLLLAVSSIDNGGDAEQQDQTLRPGQTMQWHLRLEVLAVKTAQTPEVAH